MGLTNGRPQTDHVISRPLRGLEKNHMGRGQDADTATDIPTTRPSRPRPEGRVGENCNNNKKKSLLYSSFSLRVKVV